MSKKRRSSAKAKLSVSKAQGASALLKESPRDRPKEDYAKHHDVVARAAGIGGVRVRSRLELLLVRGDISAVESEAGRRFGRDWMIGINGEGGSCLSFKVRGSGDGHLSETRLDATRDHRLASYALEHDPRARPIGNPTSTLIRFIINDTSFHELAASMGCRRETAKARVCLFLTVLADHYARVDAGKRINSTLQTKEAALKRFDPDDLRNPFTANRT